MIDTLPSTDRYNVASLHYALPDETKGDLGFDVTPLQLPGAASPPLIHTPHSSDAETDYDSRRMSSSAASDSSSRPDKRAFDFSPSASPVPKRPRPENDAWPADDARSDPASPRVQLPSLAAAFHDRHELRRASLPSSLHDTAARLRLPAPRPAPSPAASPHGLASYTFPAPTDADDARRPRLEANTQLYDYDPAASFSYANGSPLSAGDWAPARPSSTPATDARLYGGVSRIAGQQQQQQQQQPSPGERRGSVKTEGDWAFPAGDFAGGAAPAPAIAVTPTREGAGAGLVERPPRKRGKLPKPVTDYLKDWLHRHSDHPYPSEEEKKQLCNATGLSMSQVSNWMINARRRILAPAHRAAAGPQTNLPYAAPRPSVLDTGRRASMPADSLTLYHPLSLQSLPEYAPLSSTRHMVGMSRSLSSSHASVGHGHHPYSMDAYHGRIYGASGTHTLHPSQHIASQSQGQGQGQGYLSVPMSAPASLSGGNPFYGGTYGRVEEGGRYAFPDHGHSVSPQPGSGYTTPH